MSLLIETAFKASFVVAAAAIANVLLRRRMSAASTHLVWTLAVTGLLVLPILSALLPRWDVGVPVAASNAAAVVTAGESMGPADVPSDASPTPPGAAASETVSADIVRAARTGSRMPWVALLPVAYVAVSCLLMIRLVYERWMVRRLARRAAAMTDPEWTRILSECAVQMDVRVPVRLLRSLERSMPMAFGIRQPSILIPSVADTWPDDRRRAVLLHELAHIARRDCLTQLMAAVACAAYWIHPGAWWIARRLRVDRELACDDRVLAAGAHARDYAEHLLELAYTLGAYRAPALVVSMARPRHVEGRMLAVLDAARNRTAPALRSRLAGAAIAAALLVPIAAAHAVAVSAKVPAGERAAAVDTGEAEDAANAAAITEKGLAGTWEIRTTQTAPVVYLRLSETPGSAHGTMLPIERLEGLSRPALSGGGTATFSIRRDAGVLAFEGTFRSGVGAGTYTFTPSPGFPAELVKRGFARPTRAQQYLLARGDVGFAFLDELTAQRYARPDLPQLVRAAEHGIDPGFVREMGALGYRLGQIEALITLRDHGVSPQFIRELGAQGLARLTADDLVRARDHGVSPAYVGELKALGYGQLSLDVLVGARDHGISPEYVRDLRQIGYQLTLVELTSARDHGVSVEYIRDLSALGYQRLPLDALIAARAHGVSPEYARDLRDLGYRLTIDELAKARDHGVSAEYVRELKTQGRTGLTMDELIAMRDRGETPVRGKALHPVGLKLFVAYHVQAVHRWYKEIVDYLSK